MQLTVRMTCFVLLAGALVMAVPNSEIKISKCCTEVSVNSITAPIIGFRIQRKSLPCIHAVIFRTTEGEVCSHWSQDWVAKKITELKQARKAKNTSPATTTTTTTTTSSLTERLIILKKLKNMT